MYTYINRPADCVCNSEVTCKQLLKTTACKKQHVNRSKLGDELPGLGLNAYVINKNTGGIMENKGE